MCSAPFPSLVFLEQPKSNSAAWSRRGYSADGPCGACIAICGRVAWLKAVPFHEIGRPFAGESARATQALGMSDSTRSLDCVRLAPHGARDDSERSRHEGNMICAALATEQGT